MKRLAVVLFNLGGPDSEAAVEPFLYNLFSDPAIIRVPSILRSFIAKRIARRRAPVAQEIYRHLGGCSPILRETLDQAEALEQRLSEFENARVFTCMRYWHPRSEAIAMQVKNYSPDRIILLPLYPQFSTTTTASSLNDWKRACDSVGLKSNSVSTTAICCYPTLKGFIETQVELINPYITRASSEGPFRLILSAHGLPERIIRSGDPYAWQVESTGKAIVRQLKRKSLDWVIAYQSRVGPLRWIGPSTDDEIKKAGQEGLGIILVPIAFVSEHSETLVELDIEYKKLAKENGTKYYLRVPTVRIHQTYIKALADLIVDSIKHAPGDKNIVLSPGKELVCPSNFIGCPHREANQS